MRDLGELDRELEAARVVAHIRRDVGRRIAAWRRRERRDMLFLALVCFGCAVAILGATWLPW